MFPFGKSKKHPHLAEFLLEKGEMPPEEVRYYGAIASIIGGSVLLGVALAALTKAVGMPLPQSILTGLGVATFASGGLILGGKRFLRSLRPQFSDVESAGRRVVKQMKTSLDENRLKRDAHPAVLELLDAAALDWKRVQTALSGHFWKREGLPEHWVRMRDQAGSAADRTMFELLVMLQTGFQPDRKEHLTWQEEIARALEQVGLMETKGGLATMPPEVEPAYQLSLRLKELAEEIERTSAEVARTELSDGGVRFTADRDLRDTLAELKHIREAEQEIQRDINS